MTRQVTFVGNMLATSGTATQDDLDTADYVFDVADDIEDWRLSVDADGELVIAYAGEDRDTALASLAADQATQQSADEAAVAEANAE
jgi:hypothetical protein